MTAWGNAIAQPWHKRTQPRRLVTVLEHMGWSAVVVQDAPPPGGRTPVHCMQVNSAGQTMRGQVFFREGSFRSAVLHGRRTPIAPRKGEPPWQALERFIVQVEDFEKTLDPSWQVGGGRFGS